LAFGAVEDLVIGIGPALTRAESFAVTATESSHLEVAIDDSMGKSTSYTREVESRSIHASTP